MWQVVITKNVKRYKVWQVVITKCVRYYKVWQTLLQSPSGIKCDSYYKVSRNNLCNSPHSVQMRENTDQKNFEYGYFLRNVSITFIYNVVIVYILPTQLASLMNQLNHSLFLICPHGLFTIRLFITIYLQLDLLREFCGRNLLHLNSFLCFFP